MSAVAAQHLAGKRTPAASPAEPRPAVCRGQAGRDAGPSDPPGRPDGRPWHDVVFGVPRLDDAALDDLAAVLDQPRGIVIAGHGSGDPTAVHGLARSTGWPVLADPRSGCRTLADTTIAAFDDLLRHERFAADHRPTVVLRLGRMPASKLLSQWLAASEAILSAGRCSRLA